jgi:hypothetical protein
MTIHRRPQKPGDCSTEGSVCPALRVWAHCGRWSYAGSACRVPDGYSKRTDPVGLLINIRYATERLVSDARLDPIQATRLLADLSALHFEERTSAEVSRAAKACGIKTGIAADLANPQFDIKARDAAGCLSLVARRMADREVA